MSAQGLAPTAAREASPPARRLAAAAAALNREVLWLAVVLSYGLVVLVFGGRLIAQDSWLAFLAGRLVAQHGLPSHETLTVMAAGEPWIDQQWLAQLFWYGVVAGGGIPAALIVNALVLAGSLGAVLALARRAGASARSTALVGLVCILSAAPSTVVRAQILAYPLFVAVLWLVLRDLRAPSHRVLFVLPLLAVWANVHGSVLIGAALVSAYGLLELALAVGRRAGSGRIARSLALVAAPATVLCTPYGLGTVDYYTATVGNSGFGDVVTEWQPSSFPADWPFFLLAFACVALLAREARRVAPFELAALAALLVGGLLATRHVVWFALAAAAILPRAFDGVWPVRDEPARRPRVNAILLGSLTLFLVAVAAGLTRVSEPPGFPRAAADRVSAAAGESGRVYASERFADWLLWERQELAGRVAYDARFELLSDRQLRQVALFKGRGPGWLSSLAGYGVVVLHPADEGEAVRGLRADAAFRTLFETADVVVFERVGSP